MKPTRARTNRARTAKISKTRVASSERAIALVDLDGTLADYDRQLRRDLDRFASPHEPPIGGVLGSGLGRAKRREMEYLDRRRELITSQPGWFATLPKFKLGWDVLAILRELDYRIEILTQGPLYKPEAWKDKLEWCHRHVPFMDGITITRNKGLAYGRVLVDDWPEYALKWLAWRPRGLVVMPAHRHNEDFRHPQVIRYDGTNLKAVRAGLVKARNR